MKKCFFFFFLSFLFSIFLVSESYAITLTSGDNSTTLTQQDISYQIPVNHPSLYVNSDAVKLYEQYSTTKNLLFSERNTGFFKADFHYSLSKNKPRFIFRNNLKRLLTQQIFPFHLFW